MSGAKPECAEWFALSHNASRTTMKPETDNPGPDHHAIAAVLHTYFAGQSLASPSHMREAFMPSSHIEGIWEGALASWSLDQFCSFYKGTPAPDEASRTRSIDWIDVRGTAASARATLRHGKTTFTDYFVLLKTADGWRISNKVFYGEPTGGGAE
jgi:hypothetical protein